MHAPRCHPIPYLCILPAFCTRLAPCLSLVSWLRFTLPPFVCPRPCCLCHELEATEHLSCLIPWPPCCPSWLPLCTGTTHRHIALCHDNLSLLHCCTGSMPSIPPTHTSATCHRCGTVTPPAPPPQSSNPDTTVPPLSLHHATQHCITMPHADAHSPAIHKNTTCDTVSECINHAAYGHRR